MLKHSLKTQLHIFTWKNHRGKKKICIILIQLDFHKCKMAENQQLTVKLKPCSDSNTHNRHHHQIATKLCLLVRWRRENLRQEHQHNQTCDRRRMEEGKRNRHYATATWSWGSYAAKRRIKFRQKRCTDESARAPPSCSSLDSGSDAKDSQGTGNKRTDTNTNTKNKILINNEYI